MPTPVSILTHGPLTLVASCRNDDPTGYDSADLIATSSEDGWRVTSDQPGEGLPAEAEVVALTGYVVNGTDVYGAPREIAGEVAGRSIEAASGETIILPRHRRLPVRGGRELRHHGASVPTQELNPGGPALTGRTGCPCRPDRSCVRNGRHCRSWWGSSSGGAVAGRDALFAARRCSRSQRLASSFSCRSASRRAL
jgi:hypothetical protein